MNAIELTAERHEQDERTKLESRINDLDALVKQYSSNHKVYWNLLKLCVKHTVSRHF